MGISKYNEGSIKWTIDNKDFPYIKLQDLEEGKDYPLCGMFISKDHGYGEGAVLITCDYNVNVPARYVDKIRQMLLDDEVVADIKADKCVFQYHTFVSERYKKPGYRLVFGEKK